ncbi:MAG: alpha/beta fold hydrolase [Alphaproteobacteria bacterium]|nr:alpha/beta fold hydrolase [Alphaproteobacteria bacterium]
MRGGRRRCLGRRGRRRGQALAHHFLQRLVGLLDQDVLALHLLGVLPSHRGHFRPQELDFGLHAPVVALQPVDQRGKPVGQRLVARRLRRLAAHAGEFLPEGAVFPAQGLQRLAAGGAPLLRQAPPFGGRRLDVRIDVDEPVIADLRPPPLALAELLEDLFRRQIEKAGCVLQRGPAAQRSGTAVGSVQPRLALLLRSRHTRTTRNPEPAMSTKSSPERTATYLSPDGLELFYREFGEPGAAGTPVICLPGLTRNSRDFIKLAQHLCRDRRVICPDLRGRGFSAYDPEYKNYHPGTYVRDVLALLERLGIGRVVSVGTSLGGLMTMVLAGAKQITLAGAVLNDVGPILGPGIARIQSYTGKAEPVKDWDQAVRQARFVYGAALPDLSEEQWRAFTRRGYREDGGRIRLDYDPKIGDAIRETPPPAPDADPWPLYMRLEGVPTVVIRGGLSDILEQDCFEEMGRRKPDARLVTVPNRGHVPLLDEPEALAAIDALLRDVDRTSQVQADIRPKAD